MSHEIAGRRIEYERAWLAVEAKDVVHDGGEPETYYSVRTHDYAAILAFLDDGTIPLVRQYRPALERPSLELPSGLVEPGEDPAAAVARELLEETGCEAEQVELLGAFDLDSGRMQTVQWAYVGRARVVADGPSGEEAEIEIVFVRPSELLDLLASGDFRMAGHLAVVGAALVRGLLP